MESIKVADHKFNNTKLLIVTFTFHLLPNERTSERMVDKRVELDMQKSRDVLQHYSDEVLPHK